MGRALSQHMREPTFEAVCAVAPTRALLLAFLCALRDGAPLSEVIAMRAELAMRFGGGPLAAWAPRGRAN